MGFVLIGCSFIFAKNKMPVFTEAYLELVNELKTKNIELVAVSKGKPAEDILALYHLGQRDFGENYVQELLEKKSLLPPDIRWHFIGHLQTNKVRYITSFVHLIQGIDSLKLLSEVNKQGIKAKRVINCLLQVHISKEETKFGFDEDELKATIARLTDEPMKNVQVAGLMGMASFTPDIEKVRSEFKYLKFLYDKYHQAKTSNFNLQTLSMGMSGDYKIAMEEESSMVRIGSLLFGSP